MNQYFTGSKITKLFVKISERYAKKENNKFPEKR
jgi:hypothetical protein